MWFKQSTAGTISVGPFVLGTDGITPGTALTLGTTDINVHRFGEGTMLPSPGTAVHLSKGIYSYVVSTSEVANVGPIEFYFQDNGTTALPIVVRGMVVPANPYDSLIGSSDTLQADVTQWKGTAVADYTGDAFARLGAPAGASVSADIANLDGDLVAAVGTTATLDQVVAEIDAIGSPPSGTTWYGTLVDLVWDEALTGATHNVASSAGKRLRQFEGPIVGSCLAGSTNTTTILYTDISMDQDALADQLLYFTSGTLSGQVKPIQSQSAAGVVVVAEAYTEAPAAGDAFDILPFHIHSKEDIASAVWTDLIADHTLSTTFGGKVQSLGTDIATAQGTILADISTLAGTTGNLDNLDAVVDGVGLMVGTLQGTAATIDQILSDLANNKVGTAVWSQVVESQGSYTSAQVLSIMFAVLAGVTGSAGSLIKTPDGTSTRVTATINTYNERTSMTLVPGTMA